MEGPEQKNCQYCRFLIRNEDAPHELLRCGYSYLSLPPGQRRPNRLDSYPRVELNDTCDQWRFWDGSRL